MANTRPDYRRGMTKGEIRAERRERSDRRKRRKRTIYLVLGGSLAAAFIVSLLVPGGLSGRHNAATVHSAINTEGPVPISNDEGSTIIGTGTPNLNGAGIRAYETAPATSGPHWGVTPPTDEIPSGVPARWATYDYELPDEVLVHNLMNGGIGIHYNCPDRCSELVDQLKTLPPRGNSQHIVSPYTNMDSKIAITAWRHVLYLDDFDQRQITEFIRAYLARAPRNLPSDQF